MERKFKLSYPDSKKILDELCKKDSAIDRLVYDGILSSRKEAIKVVNNLLIEQAEKMGCSLYDLCLRTIPEWSCSSTDFNESSNGVMVNITQNVRLKPIVFDLTHDGGYWKR